jgi:hypothetical protein
MKRWHPVAISAVSAVVAAVVVLGGYAWLFRKSVPPEKIKHSISLKEDLMTREAAPNKHPAPPTGLPPAPPPIPERIREGKPPPLPQSLPSGEELREQFEFLHRFLELPPDRLARIRESIERIERMPPERKKLMLERIESSGRQLPPGAQAKSGIDLCDAPEAIRAPIGGLVGAMPAAERLALAEKLKKFTKAQRAAYFEGLVAGAEAARARMKSAEPPTENPPDKLPEAAKSEAAK